MRIVRLTPTPPKKKEAVGSRSIASLKEVYSRLNEGEWERVDKRKPSQLRMGFPNAKGVTRDKKRNETVIEGWG